ncbi:hypothetical protein BGW80DRAFT_1459844 [Lactifluus volemus]|nr:hypothetical protein BGW80DRAFT_1459844 [Lactifluus volemus]
MALLLTLIRKMLLSKLELIKVWKTCTERKLEIITELIIGNTAPQVVLSSFGVDGHGPGYAGPATEFVCSWRRLCIRVASQELRPRLTAVLTLLIDQDLPQTRNDLPSYWRVGGAISLQLREHYQANQHFELNRGLRTQVNEVYLRGNGNQYPPYQYEAIENVYYWYDGNVPYYMDGTTMQRLDDHFFNMNTSSHSYVEKPQGVPHQVMNYTPDVGIQELSYPYTLQLYEPPPPMNVSDGTSLFCSPTSPCTSSSLSESPSSSQPWSDSESSPTPCQYSDDAVPSVTPVPNRYCPPPPPSPPPPNLSKRRRGPRFQNDRCLPLPLWNPPARMSSVAARQSNGALHVRYSR